MSEQQVSQLIKNILSGDEYLRKSSEEQLVQGSRTNPNELFQILLKILKESSEKDTRSFSAVFLRKQLSNYSESSFDTQLKNLSQETLNVLKSSLFVALENEQDGSIRHQICDAIGEIGGSLYENGNKWPELLSQIFTILQHSNPIYQDAALRIMSSNFEYQIDEYIKYQKELNTVFGTAFSNGTTEIQLSSIIALNSLLGVLEPQQTKSFENLVPSLLQSSLGLIKKNSDKYGDEILSALADICDVEPKFFKKDFTSLQQMITAIVYDKNIDDQSLKETATEVLILILERLPSIGKTNQDSLQATLELIFYNMVQIDKDIDPEWTHPKEGFSDAHESGEVDTDEISFGIQAVDRLMASIGQKVMLPILGVLVQKLVQNSDWRYPNAAIMALSQVGEYIEDEEQVKPIMNMVLKYYDHPNPRIRHSVCHCIGQIADDMNPKVQEIYYVETLDVMAKLLDDPIPRVVANAAACLANFVEGMSDQTLESYLKPFLMKFFQILQNSSSFTKESVVSAISTFAETAAKNFLPYYNDAVQFFFKMMETHDKKEYRQLRGMILEVLTIMAHAVEYENFKPYAETTIQMMINLQNSGLDSTDPLKSYLLSGWQRLCLIMGQNFQPYLSIIVPTIFNLLNQVFVPGNASDKTINFQTYDSEEATIAINMLSVIIDEMGVHFVGYVQEALKIIIPLCNFATNDDIRKSSVTCLSGLVKSCNLKDPQSAQILTRDFIKLLWNTSENENSAFVIKDQIAAMKDCIEVINQKFLNKVEIEEMGSKIFHVMKESEVRKQKIDKLKKEEELEEEEVQNLDEDKVEEDSLYVALGDLMGILFKTHQELTLGIVEQLYNSVLSKALQDDQSEEMHKFGIFIIDDMIEFLGIELIPDKWPHLCEALLKFCCAKSCAVRQASAYGIGVLSEKSHQVFNDLAPKCIQRLFMALQIPQGTEKNKVYGHCKDNIVSAMGKIIRQNKIAGSDLQQVIQVWFGKLPLFHDKEEAKYNHELLVDIMINNQDLILQQNILNAHKVVQVYEQVFGTKRSNEQINLKIKQNLKVLVQQQEIQNDWETIMQQVPADRRRKFEDFIKA